MANYKSLLKLQGTLNDLTFYTYRGKQVVRTRTSLNKKQVMTGPEFAGSRLSMREFGAASAVGKLIRSSLGDLKNIFCDGGTVNRLNSRILKVIQSSESPKGSRPLSLKNGEHLLRGFDLKETQPFGKRYKAPLGIQYSLLNDHLSIGFGSFIPNTHLSFPKEATHFQIGAMVMLVSDYAPDPKTGKYFPSKPFLNGKSILLDQPWLPIDEKRINLRLETPLVGEFLIVPGMAMLNLGFISFGSEGMNEIQRIDEGCAMTVLDVKSVY